MRTWERDDPDLTRPIAAPLDRCAELLGVNLATIRKAAANVEPYLRVDGTKIWSLMQLERQLCPEAFGRRRGGSMIHAICGTGPAVPMLTYKRCLCRGARPQRAPTAHS